MGCVIFALALAGLWVWPAAWVIFVLIGLASGLSAGPIMTMPADVLPPETRAIGMGLFFTIYYLLMFAGPALLGLWADAAGDAFGSPMSAAWGHWRSRFWP